VIKKKIEDKKNSIFSNNINLVILLLFQIFLFLIIFGPLNFSNYDLDVFINTSDGPSYFEFSFENIEVILSNHRTFGYPLFMKFYRIFDYDLNNWPKFNYIFYNFSILILYTSLIKTNFSKIFSFFLCSGLILSNPLYAYVASYTELMSISFLLMSVSLFFYLIKFKEKKYYIMFALCIFLSYQIRPSMVVFILFPIIFSFFYKSIKTKIIFLLTAGPLLLFCLLRLFVVGDFGFVSFNVGMLGSAIHYLPQSNIQNLKIENQKTAKMLLDTKRSLSYPCNLDNEQDKKNYYNKKKSKLYGQIPCWTIYVNHGWVKIIKEEKNIEPFPDGDPKNNEPWLHMPTLATFWNQSGSMIEIDKKIRNFSFDVYMQNKSKIFLQIFKSPFHFYKLIRDRYKNLIFFYIFLMLIFFFLRKEKNSRKIKISYEFSFFASFLIITGLNLVLLYGHQSGDLRSVIAQSFYFVPVLMSYIGYLFINNLNINKNY